MKTSTKQVFEQFKAMPPAERLAYLQGQPVTTESQAFLGGNARVGDPSAVRVGHRAVVRGIPIGGWFNTPDAATAAARDFLSDWDGEL